MSNRDYIPESDAEFNVWQGNLVTIIDANATTWVIPADTITALKEHQTTWTAAYAKASNAQNRSSADVRVKNEARDTYEKYLRSFVSEYLTYNSKVTNGDRERMAITVRSGQRTPVSVPVSFPIGKVDFSIRQQHTIHFTDSITGDKGKPAGVYGCEVWVKNGGEEPKDDSEYIYLATDTNSPYIVSYGVADIGKRIYYRFRWVNKRAQPGPWSPTVSAAVGG